MYKNIILILASVIFIYSVFLWQNPAPTYTIDATTHSAYTCLRDHGLTLYCKEGAEFCPEQINNLGVLVEDITVIECARSDGTQSELCKAERIPGYPTWELNDGSRFGNTFTLDGLAELTECTQ